MIKRKTYLPLAAVAALGLGLYGCGGGGGDGPATGMPDQEAVPRQRDRPHCERGHRTPTQQQLGGIASEDSLGE